LHEPEQFFHRVHRRLGDVPPVDAFAVHRQHDAVERAVRDHQVLDHHEEVSHGLHVVVHPVVGVFEIRVENALFLARTVVRQHANGPVRHNR